MSVQDNVDGLVFRLAHGFKYREFTFATKGRFAGAAVCAMCGSNCGQCGVSVVPYWPSAGTLAKIIMKADEA